MLTALTIAARLVPPLPATAESLHAPAPQSQAATTCAHDTVGLLIADSEPSTGNVWAVGFNGDKVVIEHWDGTCWQLTSAPAHSGSLASIAALSVA